MYIRVLGAAAGGGFPQWNCSCTNCQRLRQGRLAGSPRSQAQLALSSDEEHWFLINTSPDLRYQIEAFPPLRPHPLQLRHSPIQGIVLPSAELDACLGLLLLRECQPLTVYATAAVQHLLTAENMIFNVLQRQADQVRWIPISPGVPFALGASGMECVPVFTDGAYPGFVPPLLAAELPEREANLGFVFAHESKRMGFFPGAPLLKPELIEHLNTCDVVFFDGTFWSDDELIRLQGHGKTARDMGHCPVTETLRALSGLRARKILIHINNTNPILDEESDEHKHCRDAGWEIAFDGMDLIV